jgi:hypothetical protein
MKLGTGLGVMIIGAIVVAAAASPSSAQTTPAPQVETMPLARGTAYRVKGESTFFFRGRFMIDADGAPTAYHPGYTCDAAYPKGWKHTANLNCASRTTNACSAKGFRDNPAPGAEGTYVRCGTKKVNGRWVCSEISSTTLKQGGCTQDATANSGLDYLANAGAPGNFYGIVTDKSGTPIVQGPTDPAPGYYVSPTSLANPSLPETDPRRYVDSTTVNYVALPPMAMRALGAKKGDFVLAVNWKTGAMAGAIFADVGGDSHDLGEGSIALAAALGIPGTPKGGGSEERVVYVVFAGTSRGFPSDPKMVPAQAMAEFAKWGGMQKLMSVVPKDWTADYKKG